MDLYHEDSLRSTEDGSLTLFDREANQTFHSDRGAVTEARHVYVGGSGVADRLAMGQATTVVEVGLGTGLNLLLTLDAAIEHHAPLRYRALERQLPDLALVRALKWSEHLVHPGLAEAWLDTLASMRSVRPDPSGVPQLLHAPLPGGARLDVALGPATDPRGVPHGAAKEILEAASAHAIYHDAFSPAASPLLWSESFLHACARALAPGGVWVSYSVAGSVRRTLQREGLEVRKRPGPPGGKREMSWAARPETEAAERLGVKPRG